MKVTTRIGLLVLILILSINAVGLAGRAGLLKIPEVSRDEVICFALYTVQDNTLKLTAQLYPLKQGEDRYCILEADSPSGWKRVDRAQVNEKGWTCLFRVENWDSSRDVRYRVRHGNSAEYEGVVKKDPVDKEEIVVAAFTGNSIYPGHGGDIPKDDIIKNLKHIKPDLLFFSGDQVYDHNRHYAYWLRFGRDFGEVIRNTPTVTIPDDHDVGQANLWGHGGRLSHTRAGHDGGYAAPLEYVKEVERAQTSHLPDPYDPMPIDRGIGVYYTDLTVGRVNFAIIEDRKFKTGPQGLIPKQGPRPDHILNPDYDPKSVDVPEARLLGERQLEFLEDWGTQWSDCEMKAVLSQTIFAGGAHLHGRRNNRLHADLDSNGWPQTGRNKALAAIRKAFAVHIAGDQHLATIIHHGIDDWNDACYSLCVPSIANLYLRWWMPLEEGKNREPGMPPYLGEFKDGFGNKVTMLAVANPDPEENHNKLTTRAAGFGVARFNKQTRKITLECWPRKVDVSDPKARQYPGWPRTIDQQDNYARKPAGYLPQLKVSGIINPVVQVIRQSSGEVIYTLRIKGNTFRPKVFADGSYTVRVGEPADDNWKTLENLDMLPGDQSKTVDVRF